jgi:hypothetical protein
MDGVLLLGNIPNKHIPTILQGDRMRGKTLKTVYAAGIVLLCSLSTTKAATFYVNENGGSHVYTKLKYACDACGNGDHIIMQTGTTEPGFTISKSNLLIESDDIHMEREVQLNDGNPITLAASGSVFHNLIFRSMVPYGNCIRINSGIGGFTFNQCFWTYDGMNATSWGIDDYGSNSRITLNHSSAQGARAIDAMNASDYYISQGYYGCCDGTGNFGIRFFGTGTSAKNVTLSLQAATLEVIGNKSYSSALNVYHAKSGYRAYVNFLGNNIISSESTLPTGCYPIKLEGRARVTFSGGNSFIKCPNEDAWNKTLSDNVTLTSGATISYGSFGCRPGN